MIAHKTIFSITAFASAMIFGGGVLLYMNLGDVAKVLAEKIATQTLGVEVRIGHMDIDIPNQTLSVKNILIANPPGYDSPYAMRAGSVTMSGINLSKELLSLGSIDVQKTNIVLDVTGDGSNLKDIADNAQKNKSNSAQGTEGEAAVKVAIQKLNIEQTKLIPAGILKSTGVVGEIEVEPITMTGIGTESNAVLASQAISQIWQQVFQSVMRSAMNQSLLNELGSDLLGTITEGTGISLQSIGSDQIRSIGGELNEKGREALEKLFR